MRCDSRLLSSFITGALTATTVTLFLLRVVPGTYVVLPCDPTITARPVLMEEYLDRVDKQQEVFPDDGSLVDTRPLHKPAVLEVSGAQQKKGQNKHQNLKKKKSSHQGLLQPKDPTVNSKKLGAKEERPKDLQQQLKDLQEKEDREKESLQKVPQVVLTSSQKLQRKLQQNHEKQVDSHLKEIKVHLQEEANEIKRKLKDEREKYVKQQHQRLLETHQDRNYYPLNKIEDDHDGMKNKVKPDQTSIHAWENNNIPEDISHISIDSRAKKLYKDYNSLLLEALLSSQSGARVNNIPYPHDESLRGLSPERSLQTLT
ncbi:hypothetical protein SK128_010946 [Halocaridina rubra]|uniref:Uncharacterized protein n=1 Tax=Halocaridina rubra TaxID=373956 RepID=A0AAN8WIF7_HALRR